MAASRQIWNLPNVLTMARIALVPVLVWLLADSSGSQSVRWWAFAVFVVAMITDLVDGYLARSMGLVTAFGKLMDPIADKALVGAALIMLSVQGELWWVITGLILAREVLVTGGRLWLANRMEVAADRWGKLKTLAQTVGLSLLLTPWTWTNSVLHGVAIAILIFATVLTWTSGWAYLAAMVKVLRPGRSRVQ